MDSGQETSERSGIGPQTAAGRGGARGAPESEPQARPPKSEPDGESLRAGWYTVAEMARLPLRGDEVAELCREVLAGCPVAPLALLGPEQAS